jgi:hypothetical protein
MSIAPLMPFILPRQFTIDGQPLAAGKIYFYESGTRTPKPTFNDPLKTVYNTNPVILDAAGFHAVYLDSGYYTVIVTDSNDVQLEQPMDGITGSGGSGNGSDVVNYVLTYNDLRALTSVYDLVYVGGRSFEGDGGEGWFYRDPNTQLSDDDGYILTSSNGSVKYVRLNQTFIDPRFYGVVYSSVANQYSQFMKALTGSVTFGLDVVVNGNIYLNQYITVPAKASISVTELGSFTSTASIGIQFSPHSNFKALGRTFGLSIQPYFDVDTVDAIRLSWMAGNVDDDRLIKLFGSAVNNYVKMVIDETATVASGNWSCQNPISFESGSIISFTNGGSALVLSMKKIEAEPIKILQIENTTSISSITFGDNPANIEWFGGLGDDSNDDSFPLWQATWSGYVKTVKGKTYKIGSATPPSYPSSFSICGDGIIKLYSTKTLGTGVLELVDVTIQTPSPHTWFAGSSLVAINVTMPSTYTATTSFIDGCVYSDDALNRYPVSNGKPAIYNGYLPLLPGASILGTNGYGKIVNNTKIENVLTNFTFNNVEPQTYSNIKILNGAYWIVGSNGFCAKSSDYGATWNTVSISGATYQFNDITWTGTNYVIVGGYTLNGVVYTSPDGVNWTYRSISTSWGTGSTFALSRVASNGQYVVICNSYGKIGYSSDHGVTFSNPTTLFGGLYGLVSLNYVNGMFVVGAGGASKYAASSNTSGTAWNSYTATGVTSINYITTDKDNNFVFCGDNGYIGRSSTINGTFTKSILSPTTDTITGLVYNNGAYVAIGQNGRILVSDTMTRFTQRFSGVTVGLVALVSSAYVSGDNYVTGFYIIGGSGTSLTSQF